MSTKNKPPFYNPTHRDDMKKSTPFSLPPKFPDQGKQFLPNKKHLKTLSEHSIEDQIEMTRRTLELLASQCTLLLARNARVDFTIVLDEAAKTFKIGKFQIISDHTPKPETSNPTQ